MAVAAAIVTILLPPPSARAALVSDPDAVAAAFIWDINQVRASNGLAPFALSAELTSLARSWSAQQAAAGGISHNLHMYDTLSGSHWLRLNENVGVGDSEAEIESAFLASPDHVANYINTNYTHVGVGVVVTSDAIFVTEDFGQAAGSVVAPPPVAAPPVTRAAAVPTGAAAAASPALEPTPVVLVPAPPPAVAPTSARVGLVLEQLRSLDGSSR